MKITNFTGITIKTQEAEESLVNLPTGESYISFFWKDVDLTHYQVKKNKYKTIIEVNKTTLQNCLDGQDISNNKQIKLVLQDTNDPSIVESAFSSANFEAKGKTLKINLQSALQSSGAITTFELTSSAVGTVKFDKSGDTKPYLELADTSAVGLELKPMDIPLTNHVRGKLDLKTGEVSTVINLIKGEDSVHGVGVSLASCGDGYKLNLDETFKNGVYTDPYGKQQTATEKFYRIEDGKKVYVEKLDVKINADGTYNIIENGVKIDVFREEFLTDKVKATTIPQGLKNEEIFEKRFDEKVQKEEQIRSCKEYAENCVVWKYKRYVNGSRELEKFCDVDIEEPTNLTAIKNAVENDNVHISTKAEFVQLKNLYKQLELCLLSYDEPEDEATLINFVYPSQTGIKTDTYYSEMQLHQTIYESQQRLKNYFDNYKLSEDLIGVTSTPSNWSGLTICNLTPFEVYLDDDKKYYHNDYQEPTEDNPYPNNDMAIPYILGKEVKSELRMRNMYIIMLNQTMATMQSQVDFTYDQAPIYTNQTERYLTELETVFKNYHKFIEEKKELVKNYPISYIQNGDFVKGYNEDGELVTIFKSNEEYVSVNRDKDGKILSLVDENGQAVIFKYDLNENLKYVTDIRGRDLKITKTNSEITVSYPSDETETVKVETDVITVSSSDFLSVKLSFTDSSLTEIQYLSGATELKKVTVAYDTDLTAFTCDDTVLKYYLTNNYINKTVKLIDGKVVEAKLVEYFNADNATHIVSKIETLANKDSLYSLETALTFDGDRVIEEYDEFGKLESKKEKTQSQTVTTIYEYDEFDQVIKETASILRTGETNPTCVITAYSYDLQKRLVKRVSYVVGEELINGKTVEEWVYDEKGNLTKSFTYNTLDSSSKFFAEHIYSADGKHIAELDQTGENRMEIEYVEKTSLVKTQKLPNGSKFSYGYDLADNVTSITQSTQDGEENSTQRIYQNGLLKKLISGNTTVEYVYDNKRRVVSVKVNGAVEKSYAYSEDEKTVTETARDGTVIAVTKDGFGNVSTITKNQTEIESNVYEKGLLKSSFKNDVTYTYTYDSADRVIKITYSDGSPEDTFTYNSKGNLVSSVENGVTSQYLYSSDSSNKLLSITKDGVKTVIKTDLFGRKVGNALINSSNSTIYEEQISYSKKGDCATNLPNVIRYSSYPEGLLKDTLKYSYDSCGNITQINENGKLLVRYTYDSINRLIREDNAKLNQTYFYEYDTTGNRISKQVCAFTLDKKSTVSTFTTDERYMYDKDVLIGRSSSDRCYYANGKMTAYFNQPISFKEGGLISSFRNTSFTYDDYGKRLTKGNIAYTYSKNGLLLSQTDGTMTLTFIYDCNNEVIGIAKTTENSTETYYFRKNIQGDVIMILDSYGLPMVKYVYDAWGNHKVFTPSGTEITDTTNIGHINPIRYRGYYYDREIGLYFLKTRYYDSKVGRFISPDSVEYLDPDSINGLNLYAYCNNNPVMYTDPSGHFTLPNWAKWLIGGVAFAGAVALTIVSGGSLAPVFIGMGVSIASSSLIEGVISVYNGEGFWQGVANGAADGALWGGIFALVGAGISAIKYTRGFRVVGLNEYDDIARTGKFASNGFSEGKYFWTSKLSAKEFVSKMGMTDDVYKIVGVRISRTAFKTAIKNGSAYFWTSLDDIGRAFFVDISVVNQIVSRIWTVF